MADFCNFCAMGMFGNKNFVDINIHEEATQLYEMLQQTEENESVGIGGILCEGCGLISLEMVRVENRKYEVYGIFGDTSSIKNHPFQTDRVLFGEYIPEKKGVTWNPDYAVKMVDYWK